MTDTKRNPNSSKTWPAKLSSSQEHLHMANISGPTCTHPSYDQNFNNATLETFGDMVLALHVGSQIYAGNLDITQAQLSTFKAINVDNENLARAYFRSGLHVFLNHHIFGFVGRVTQFGQEVNEFPTHSSGRIDSLKALADMLEAVVGVVWVDSQRDLIATGAVIDNLFGVLIVNSAVYGQRPIQQL